VFIFERVLFATDFSEYSFSTLECVSEIPGVREVTLLHVVDATHPSKKGWVYDRDIKNAEIELESQKKHLHESGIQGRVRLEVITSGDVAEAIMSAAKDEEASLIVTGARGKGLIQRVLLGSVSKAVLQRAKGHVLIIRYGVVESFEKAKYEKFCQGIFTRVLYPTDFSYPASAVVPLLKNLEGLRKVIVLHVITRGETKQEIDTYVDDAKRRLETIAGDLRKAGKEAEIAVRLGSPMEEINFLAEEEDVSLIVMGRHGHGRMREMVLGSTAYMVAKRTKRPIFIAGLSQIPEKDI
jgi:nucleotide-binding universal stress UspA family protein